MLVTKTLGGNLKQQGSASRYKQRPGALHLPPEQRLVAGGRGLRVGWKQYLVPAALVLSDAFLALLTVSSTIVVQALWGEGALPELTIAAVIPVVLAWVLLRAVFGLYPGYGMSAVEELRRQTYALSAIVAVLSILVMSFHVGHLLSRLLLAAFFAGLLVMAPLGRVFTKWVLHKVGLWGKPVIVIGAGEAGSHLISTLEREWMLGLKPVGVFGYWAEPTRETIEGIPFGGTLEDGVRFGREKKVDTAIFAMPYTRREDLAPLVDQASVAFPHVIVTPNLGGITNAIAEARDLGGVFGVEIKFNLLHPWAKRAKRLTDFSSALAGLVLLSPLLAAIFVAIKLDSPGPALFSQKRPGQDGEMFRVLKFRTMCLDAEQKMEELFRANPLLAREFEEHGKLKNDPRVTRIGRWLRRLSLDELPQLWNVLKGEMSLIGPRPYLIEQAAQTTGAATVIARVGPGISGLWQVSGRSDMTIEERLALDLYYVRNWSVWLDLVILARTVRIMILRSGAY